MAAALPPTWQKKFKSDYLKERIVDDGLWVFIPGVDPNMNSARGRRRLKQNEALFSFVDTYFPEGPFAIEPNMRDGRFVLIPEDYYHQGMGICASLMVPGALEVGHFWYPRDFCSDFMENDPDLVYVPVFTTVQFDELAETARSVYVPADYTKESEEARMRCVFPFLPGLTVTLDGPFMDDADKAARPSRRRSGTRASRSGVTARAWRCS